MKVSLRAAARMLFLAAVCLCLPLPLWSAPANLLPNGDFAQAGAGWSVETGQADDNAGGPNRVDWPEPDAGNACAELSFTGRNWLWLDLGDRESASLPLQPGEAYTLSFLARWLRGDNRLSVGFNFRGREDGAWQGGLDRVGQLSIPKDRRWRRVSLTFAAPLYDANTTYLQFKLGAHAALGISAETLRVADLSLTAVPPMHRLTLRFEDRSPADGCWGANLHRLALSVNAASAPSIAFRCGTPQERFLTAEQGKLYPSKEDSTRVADGTNAFAYEIPLVAPELRKLALELDVAGDYLLRFRLDGGPLLPADQTPRPVQDGSNRRILRLQALPLAGSNACVFADGERRPDGVLAWLAPDPRWPAGSSVEWRWNGKRIHTDVLTKSGEAGVPLRLDTAPAADRRWTASLTVTVRDPAGKQLARTADSLDVPDFSRFDRCLTALAKDTETLRGLDAEAERRQLNRHDADILLTALARYPSDIREDLEKGKTAQAIAACEYLQSATAAAITQLKQTLKRGERVVETPLPSTHGLQIHNGSLVQGDRPVFLIGPMGDRIAPAAIDEIARFGFNAVELVVAPAWNSPEDYQYYREFLAACARRNIAVYVLLSAHYYPQSWSQQDPALTTCGDFCLPWCLCDPRLREYIGAWYQQIIPFLREQPAVFSYCLANEPHYINTGACDNCKAAFRAWLRRRYGGVDALNRRWGTRLAAFEQAEPAVKRDRQNPAPYVDWYAFNDYRLGDFFRWEREAVRHLDTRTPIHNECMAWDALNPVNDGIDREDQAALSDLDGCDGGTVWSKNGGTYALDWLHGQALPYDLMKSIAPEKPIFNSEWHIVTQDEPDIPPQYLRATAWLATVCGQSGATIWVWARQWGEQKCMFLSRPGSVVTTGAMTRELNRFAREASLFQRPPAGGRRQVCLLYSTSSLIHDGGYGPACERAYETLAFLDAPLGFLTERQLAQDMTQGCKLLVVPKAANVTDACLAGIERFVRQGGTLLLLDDCLGCNEYGDQRAMPAFLQQDGTVGQGRVLHWAMAASTRPALDRLLTECGVDRPLRSGTAGVFCRSERDGNRLVTILINLTNAKKDVPLTVAAPHGAQRDLLTGRTLAGKIRLAGLQAALVETPLR